MYWRQVVSQSPTTSLDGRTLLRYQQGWRALNRLLHSDRSFSGSERNCAFLNLGNRGDFASVSAVSGLDYLDDGRAVATTDWDFDGRPDLWLTARTAPRLRFVRNQSSQQGHYVALLLRGNGTTTNRDAVGARVEVHCAGKSGETLIKTRHAGDGFLTQSSGWLHFGLGEPRQIERVVVRWPGGEPETFNGVVMDAFQILKQGSTEAEVWTPPPARKTLIPSTHERLAASDAARIIPPYHLPLPRVQVEWQSEPSTNAFQDGHVQFPTLVTVWTSSCPNCLGELSEWSRRAADFSERGLNVIALNADGDSSAASQIIEQVKFPFPWGVANSVTIRCLDLFQRGIMDRWQPMPVPCSFLLDGNHGVVAVYKGPADIAQVFRDLELIDATPEQLRIAGSPFAGRWAASTPVADPLRISTQMIDRALVGEAVAYLEQFIQIPTAKANPLRLADVKYVLSVLLESRGQKERALAVLQEARQLSPEDVRIRAALGRLLGQNMRPEDASVELAEAVRINPADRQARMQLAVALMESGKAIDAMPHLTALLKQNPKDANILYLTASCLYRIGDWPSAIKRYREVLSVEPRQILAANNLAYILAAHPNPSLRDEKEAVRLAKETCSRTRHANPQFLDTLAVAYAADGQFDQAIEMSQRAVKLLEKNSGNERSIEAIQARIKLFQEQKPFREEW